VIESAAQLVVLLTLGASVVVAVARVWKPIGDWIEMRDIFLVVPDWKFFAPTPNRSDYHIVARQRQGTALPSSWSTVFASRRTSLRPRAVDPDRRIRKALVDVATHYLTLSRYRRHEAADELRPTISTSMVYLLLLSAVSAVALLGVEVQFAIVATRDDPDDAGEIIMTSDFHPVER